MYVTRILTFVILFLIYIPSKAQRFSEMEDCSTEFTEADKKAYFQSLMEFRKEAPYYRPTKIATIAVSIHIAHNDDGSGGVTEKQAIDALERVNSHYKEAGIEFFVCELLNHNSSSLYKDKGDKTQYEKLNTLHIWFVGETGGSCGYASFPGGADRATLNNRCVTKGTTFEHELGHNFGLPHTHTSGEWVARPGSGKPTNCDKKGDGFCDTPADPTLSSAVNESDCVVKKNLGNDSQGDAYKPDPYNVMAYSAKSCRSVFSEEQISYMNWVANKHSDRNKFTCNKIEPDFKIKSALGCNGTIQFYDYTRATKDMTYQWTFSQGSPSTSTDENPNITYEEPGEYEVTLEVTNKFGTEKINRTVTVKKTEAIELPFEEDFEIGEDALSSFEVQEGALASVLVDKAGGNTNNGLILDGGDNSIYHTKPTPPMAFITNPHYNSSAGLYCVDLTKVRAPVLRFDYKLLFGTSKFYTNFRVTINGKEVKYYRPESSSDSKWNTEEIDLTEYTGKYVDIVFEGSSKYNHKSNNPNGVFIDNIIITGPSVGIGNILENITDFAIAPNPTNGNINVKFSAKSADNLILELRNILGEIVYQQQLNGFSGNFQKSISLENSAKGLYLFNITSKEGLRTSKKVFKN